MAGRASTYEQRVKQLEAMIAAGTGVQLPAMQTPEDRELAEAQAELVKIFPQLALLKKLEKMFPQLEETLPRIPDLLASGDQYWVGQAHRTLDQLHIGAAEMYGIKPQDLSPLQQQAVGDTFMRWLQSDDKIAERYARGDANVVKEFLTEWRTAFFEPARRVGQGGGAPPPGGGRRDLPPAPHPSGVVPGGAPPPKAKTEDEVHDAAWQGFSAALASRRP